MEIIVLTLIAFLVFGPKQFPLVAKNFIKFLNELKRTFTEVKSEFYDVQTETKKHIQQITTNMGKDFQFVRDFQPENFFLNKEKQTPTKEFPADEHNKGQREDLALFSKKKKKDS